MNKITILNLMVLSIFILNCTKSKENYFISNLSKSSPSPEDIWKKIDTSSTTAKNNENLKNFLGKVIHWEAYIKDVDKVSDTYSIYKECKYKYKIFISGKNKGH